MVVGDFSSARAGGPLPVLWQPLTFKNILRHTAYSLVNDSGISVIKAVSQQAASGLKREVSIDSRVYPIMAWRWKVSNILAKGDVSRKTGDDYPARIYVTFAYDPGKADFITRTKYMAAKLLYGAYPPLYAINYIWANKAPVGTRVPNPYISRSRMIVLNSGASQLNRWVTHQRNIYEDYLAAFGHPPPPISGIAIMTDTDNTAESATAFYGDISFHPPE